MSRSNDRPITGNEHHEKYASIEIMLNRENNPRIISQILGATKDWIDYRQRRANGSDGKHTYTKGQFKNAFDPRFTPTYILASGQGTHTTPGGDEVPHYTLFVFDNNEMAKYFGSDENDATDLWCYSVHVYHDARGHYNKTDSWVDPVRLDTRNRKVIKKFVERRLFSVPRERTPTPPPNTLPNLEGLKDAVPPANPWKKPEPVAPVANQLSDLKIDERREARPSSTRRSTSLTRGALKPESSTKPSSSKPESSTKPSSSSSSSSYKPKENDFVKKSKDKKGKEYRKYVHDGKSYYFRKGSDGKLHDRTSDYNANK